MKKTLTKSDVLAWLQCPRKLWLQENQRDLAEEGEDSTNQRRAVDGEYVGSAAVGRFPKKLRFPYAQDLETAATHARQALGAQPKLPGVEVPMYFGGLYARADALKPVDGGYVLEETKASTFPLKRDKLTPDKPEEHHVHDAAIQAWVARESGIPVQRVELNLLNSRWKLPDDLDYAGLFRQLDITDDVAQLQAEIPVWFAGAQKTLTAKRIPQAETGAHCKKPFDCPFAAHCKSREPAPPEHPIELLPEKAGKDLARKLKTEKGYVSITQPAPEELVGKNAAQYIRIQRAHALKSQILEPGSEDKLNALPYPRYFFDFEGIDFPVPRWAGVRPYEQIPFQWSCHIERTPGVFEHAEFLDLSGDDPSLACIEKMLECLPDDGGPIFVYHATYEKGRLEELGLRHPQHAEALQGFINRLVDLLPLVKQFLYDYRMKGSYSIKKVLPVVAPDLSYDKLEGVQHGSDAQFAYLLSIFEAKHPDDLERRAQELFVYCEQDTWAMVEVAYFLARRGKPTRPIVPRRPLGERKATPDFQTRLERLLTSLWEMEGSRLLPQD